MLKLLATSIGLAAVLSFTTAYADTKALETADKTKIGVLDMQQIMQDSPEVSKLNKQLQSEFKPRQDKIVAAQKEIQNDMAKLKKDASVMSNADKTKLENKINTEQAAYMQTAQSFQQDLSKAQSQAMQKFMSNLQTAVNKVAKAENYSLIVNRAAVPYFDPSLDMTKEVLQTMEK